MLLSLFSFCFYLKHFLSKRKKTKLKLRFTTDFSLLKSDAMQLLMQLVLKADFTLMPK